MARPRKTQAVEPKRETATRGNDGPSQDEFNAIVDSLISFSKERNLDEWIKIYDSKVKHSNFRASIILFVFRRMDHEFLKQICNSEYARRDSNLYGWASYFCNQQ